MHVENWSETTDRESALVAATVGLPMRRFRPITESYTEGGDRCVRYHFEIGAVVNVFLGSLNISHFAHICTGSKLAIRGRINSNQRHVVILLRDYIRNHYKLNDRFAWAKDRPVAIACLTLGMKYTIGATSVVNHKGFAQSFTPVDDPVLGRVTAKDVTLLMQSGDAPTDDRKTTVVRWMRDMALNIQTFEDWQKNKVMPMVTISGKVYDMTIGIDAPDRVVDSMRRMERRQNG